MDFLNRFVAEGGHGGGNGHSAKRETLDEENVELNLGLSLNGRFGVNNNYDQKNNTLIRASSIADFSSAKDDLTPLTRTCSLPIETEVERKKRRELQSLRRSEAKRKRVEKLKNGRIVKVSSPEENYETKRRNLINATESCPSSPPSSLLPPLPRPSPFPAQASIGSPPSGESSGVSDLESQPFSEITGANKETELKSTASQQLDSNTIASNKLSAVVNENPTKDETLKTMLADMPCVTTKGEGVNGKKIEGFLYRYRKGEQVRIVCVCHGSFLTPAEFVKHGGGGDVQHPLRHIIVNPPTL